MTTNHTPRTLGGVTLAGGVIGVIIVACQLVTQGAAMLAYEPSERLDTPTTLTEVQHYQLLAVYVAAALLLIAASTWLGRRSLAGRLIVVAGWTAAVLLVGIEVAARAVWTVVK